MTRLSYVDVPSIYCACGVQWHGKYALRDLNPVIDLHASRIGRGCLFIPQDAFAARFGLKTIKHWRQRALQVGGTHVDVVDEQGP